MALSSPSLPDIKRDGYNSSVRDGESLVTDMSTINGKSLFKISPKIEDQDTSIEVDTNVDPLEPGDNGLGAIGSHAQGIIKALMRTVVLKYLAVNSDYIFYHQSYISCRSSRFFN